MIEKACLFLAQAIRNNGGDERVSVERLQFSLNIVICSLFILVLTGLTGHLWSSSMKAFLSLGVIGLLRYFSGGWHLRTGMQCIIFTVALVNLVIILPPIQSEVLQLFFAISLILVIILAPTGHGQRIKSARHKTLFKWMSILIVIISLLIWDQVITISILCQSISLITMKGGEKDAENGQNSFSSAV